MNNISPFNFESKTVRVVFDERGEPLFIAKDVAEALEYTWNGTSRIEHVPTEWRGVTSVVTPYGTQEMAVLTEQGLYFFLGRSDKQKALPLQKWIAGQVLPTIRKTGSYSIKGSAETPTTPLLPETRAVSIIKAFMDLGHSWSVPEHLLQIESVKEARTITGFDFSPLLRLAPAQSNIPQTDIMLEPTELGKEFGLSAIKMNLKLADLGLQVREGTGWKPTTAAKGMWSKHAWSKGSKSGYNLKWNLHKVKETLAVTV